MNREKRRAQTVKMTKTAVSHSRMIQKAREAAKEAPEKLMKKC